VTITAPQIKYQFIAVANGIINFGYALVDNATVSQVENIIIYEGHGYTAQASQSSLDFTSTGYIDADAGSIDDLSVNDSFTYKGTELTPLLNPNDAKGIVAFGTYTPGTTTTTAELAIAYLDFRSLTNRLYKIRTGVMSHSTAGQKAEFRIRTTGNGTTPTVTSGLLCTSYQVPQFEGAYCDELSSVGAGPALNVRMVLTMASATGSAVTLAYVGQIRWFVEDMGAVIAQTGGTTPATPSNYHSFDIQPTASVTYTSPQSTVGPPSQGIVGLNNNLMFQGDDRDGAGNYRAWCTFDRTTAGFGSGGSLTDIVGVAAANVDYMRIFLYYDHWYYVDPFGGPVPGHNLQISCLGWHNWNGTLPAFEQPGGFPNLIRTNWGGRNTGQWIDIKGTAIATAVLAGTFRGFVIGNTGSANFEEFGHCFGANGVNGRQPGFQAAYYK
jgi:hypothetical protein